MKRKETFFLVSLICLFSVFLDFNLHAQDSKTNKFVSLNGKVGAGIIFDNHENMFVCKNDELLRIKPDGKKSQFVNLAALPKGKDYHFSSPLIWDMVFDSNGNILAAAQDRILKISPDGVVSTIIKENFEGLIGASGIALDSDNNIYVTNGNKIIKYNSKFDRSVYIDASMSKLTLDWQGMSFDLDLKSFINIAFDPTYKNLYVSEFYTNTLLKYPIKEDGNPDKPIIVFDAYTDDLSQAPLNIIFDKKGNVYVSNDLGSQILRMDSAGNKSIIKIDGKLKNHLIAFGGKGFDEESIYFTTYNGDYVYKTLIGK